MGWQDRFSLAGRKALVTGASKGIGAEIARVAPALELSAEDWEATMAVNLRAPFLLSQALPPP